jgi:hypothetical protein
MTADDVFRLWLDASNLDPDFRLKLKLAVISIWAANSCPAVIEMTDHRHGDQGKVYFVFRREPWGLCFWTQYTFPTSENLTIPEGLSDEIQAWEKEFVAASA